MQQIQAGYKSGIRCKSFTITSAIGVVEETLQLSGLAKHLLGAVVTTPGADTAASLIVNNDVVIEDLNLNLLTSDAENPRQYYDFGRPLTGNDDIELRVTDTAANTFTIVLYFVNQNQ